MASSTPSSVDLAKGTDEKNYPAPVCVYDEKMGYYHDANLDPMGKMKAGTLPQPAQTEATPFKLGK